MAELSGLEVLVLLKEIGSTLRGAYVNNIFSVGATQLFRLRKTDSADFWLVVSSKKGVWISDQVSERGETTEFTSKLRGELVRAKFTGAGQADLDRVFELGFEGGDVRKLIVELMPPGNVIVTDGDGRILLALEEVRSKARRIVRGEEYEPPRQTRVSPEGLTAKDVMAMIGEEKTVGRAIGRHVGLPRKYVSECLARLGLTDDSSSSSLQGREEEVAGVVSGIVSEARYGPSPCICATEIGDDIFAIHPSRLETKETAKSVSELCDKLLLSEVLERTEAPNAEESRKKELEVTTSRLDKESDSLLAAASRARSEANIAKTLSLQEALALLKQSGAAMTREPSSTAAVVSALFDHAKKLEQKAAENKEAAARLRKKAGKLRPPEPQKAKLLPKRRLDWFEKFRWFVTSGGKMAVGGRDAQSNTQLIKRHLGDGDVVYHGDLFGSPFFVLKGGLLQSDQEVLELAQATVSFSSGWKTGLGAADAYWVNKEQVSATTESGEYLAKGSFVIRGKKNFVRHALIQVAIGFDNEGRVMAGPESAIAKATTNYVVIIPQREKPSDTAKKVLKALVAPSGSPPAVSLDEIVRALPPGGGKIVRTKAFTTGRDKP